MGKYYRRGQPSLPPNPEHMAFIRARATVAAKMDLVPLKAAVMVWNPDEFEALKLYLATCEDAPPRGRKLFP